MTSKSDPHTLYLTRITRITPNICYGWVFSSLLLMSTDHSFGAAGFAHLTP